MKLGLHPQLVLGSDLCLYCRVFILLRRWNKSSKIDEKSLRLWSNFIRRKLMRSSVLSAGLCDGYSLFTHLTLKYRAAALVLQPSNDCCHTRIRAIYGLRSWWKHSSLSPRIPLWCLFFWAFLENINCPHIHWGQSEAAFTCVSARMWQHMHVRVCAGSTGENRKFNKSLCVLLKLPQSQFTNPPTVGAASSPRWAALTSNYLRSARGKEDKKFLICWKHPSFNIHFNIALQPCWTIASHLAASHQSSSRHEVN